MLVRYRKSMICMKEFKTNLYQFMILLNHKELIKLEECLLKYKGFLAGKSRTAAAKLWLLYVEYVEILTLFIGAEGTENWSQHLIAVDEMLNLFAATGHITMQRVLDYICS